MKKQGKTNILKKVDDGIQTLFDAKQSIVKRNAFDKLVPFGAKSASLRKTLSILEDRDVFPEDERATRSIINLSNAIQPFLYLLNEEQFTQLNDSFSFAVNHIVRLERSIVHPPPIPEAPKPPLELDVVLVNNAALEQHIRSLEAQLQFVKDGKRKQEEKSSETIQKLEKQNGVLRHNLQQAREEGEKYHRDLLEKEKSLQMSLVHLSTAQDELKRVKFEYNLNKSAGKTSASMESFQRNSKYSAKEFVKLNATVDALRSELHRERIERAHERESSKLSIETAESKINYSEVVINELRDQLQHLTHTELPVLPDAGYRLDFNHSGRSTFTNTDKQTSGRINGATLSATGTSAVGGLNSSIEYLHASSRTTPSKHVEQRHDKHHDKHIDLNSSRLNDSPLHTLPRGSSYIATDEVTQTGETRYKYRSPFVVKVLSHAATTSLITPAATAQKRSQSAQHRRLSQSTPLPHRGRDRRSQSVPRTIRSLRGPDPSPSRRKNSSFSATSQQNSSGEYTFGNKYLSTAGLLHKHPSPHHLYHSSSFITDELLAQKDHNKSVDESKLLTHPMYRSISPAKSRPAEEVGHNYSNSRSQSHSEPRSARKIHDRLGYHPEHDTRLEHENINDSRYDPPQLLNAGEHAIPSGDEAAHQPPFVKHNASISRILPDADDHNSLSGSGSGTVDSDEMVVSYATDDILLAGKLNAKSAHNQQQASRAADEHQDSVPHNWSASAPLQKHSSFRVESDKVSPGSLKRAASMRIESTARDALHHHSSHKLAAVTEESATDISPPQSSRHLSPGKQHPAGTHSHSFSNSPKTPVRNASPPHGLARSLSFGQQPSSVDFDPNKYKQKASSPKLLYSHEEPHKHFSGKHAASFSHSPLSPESLSRHTGKHSASTSDMSSAVPFDPKKYQQIGSTSPAPALSPIQQQSKSTKNDHAELRNMSETPTRMLQRGTSFSHGSRSNMDTSPKTRDRSSSPTPLSSEKKSNSLRDLRSNSPSDNQRIDFTRYMDQATSPIKRAESPGVNRPELRHMSTSPIPQGRRSPMKANSFHDGHASPPTLLETKKSRSFNQIDYSAGIDLRRNNTSTIHEHAKEDESGSVNSVGGVEVDHDDLSSITEVPAATADKNTVTAASTAKQASHSHPQQHESVLDSLYEQIQLLKQSHLSPIKNKEKHDFSFHLEQKPSNRQVLASEESINASFTLAHTDNLAAIQQPEVRHSYGSSVDVHRLAPLIPNAPVKYADLVHEYNELMTLYVHEMRKSRSMKLDYRSEICENVHSAQELNDQVHYLQRENEFMEKQLQEKEENAVDTDRHYQRELRECQQQLEELRREKQVIADELRDAPKTIEFGREVIAEGVQYRIDQISVYASDEEMSRLTEQIRRELDSVFHIAADRDHSQNSPAVSPNRSRSHSSTGATPRSSGRQREHTAAVSAAKVHMSLGVIRRLNEWLDRQSREHDAEILRRNQEVDALREERLQQDAIIHDQNQMIATREEAIRDLETQLQNMRHEQLLSRDRERAVSPTKRDELASLTSKLESTYAELEDAKKRYASSNNLSITHPNTTSHQPLSPPHGSRSPSLRHTSPVHDRSPHQNNVHRQQSGSAMYGDDLSHLRRVNDTRDMNVDRPATPASYSTASERDSQTGLNGGTYFDDLRYISHSKVHLSNGSHHSLPPHYPDDARSRLERHSVDRREDLRSSHSGIATSLLGSRQRYEGNHRYDQHNQHRQGERHGESEEKRFNHSYSDHNYSSADQHQHQDTTSQYLDNLMHGQPLHHQPNHPVGNATRHSYDSMLHNSGHHQHSGLTSSQLVQLKSDLERRAISAEMKCELLTKQISSIPASLSVAQAEKRVLECKLQTTIKTHEAHCHQLEENHLHKISELQSFLKIEKTEKEVLQSKLKDQQTTIHQLTHHLKLVQAGKNPSATNEPMDRSSLNHTSATVSYQDTSIRVQIPPAPWETGSPAVSTSNTGNSVHRSHIASREYTEQRGYENTTAAQRAENYSRSQHVNHMHSQSQQQHQLQQHQQQRQFTTPISGGRQQVEHQTTGRSEALRPHMYNQQH